MENNWSFEYSETALKYWVCKELKFVLSVSEKEDARRIVACMNACAGISTEALEVANNIVACMNACAGISTEALEVANSIVASWNEKNDELVKTLSEVTRLRAENERLRDALESIANHYDQDGYGEDAWKKLAIEMANVARAALSETAQSAAK